MTRQELRIEAVRCVFGAYRGALLSPSQFTVALKQARIVAAFLETGVVE